MSGCCSHDDLLLGAGAGRQGVQTNRQTASQSKVKQNEKSSQIITNQYQIKEVLINKNINKTEKKNILINAVMRTRGWSERIGIACFPLIYLIVRCV